MTDFWLITLYMLVVVTLLAALISWGRSLLLRDASSFVQHHIPVRRIAAGVTILLALVLFLTSWSGLVNMLVYTIFVMIVVASVACIVSASGVLRKWR